MPPRAEPASLCRFQDDFARALRDPGSDAGAGSGVAALTRQPGFAVYRNTVLKGCIDALQANYPAVTRLVGEEWLRGAASIYARANPPSRPTLLDYGEGFARFLATFPPATDLPYLPGVARLDRFWTEAHVARDEAPADPARFAGLAPAQLRSVVLRPHAAARWAWFDSAPIFTIWQRNRAAGAVDASEIAWHGEGALIVRPHGEVRWFGLDAAGCALLDACAGGGSFAAAGAAVRATDPDADLAAIGARLFAAGAFGQASLDRRADAERTGQRGGRTGTGPR
jgi:hypothetical protein